MSSSPSRLEAFFSPRRIAVIGASEQGMYPAGVLQNLLNHGYSGRVFPVNPNRASVFGLPCYPDVTQLPERPDLAVIVVHRSRVLPVLRQCLQVGARAAVVFSSGFAEEDEEGKRLQAEMQALVSGSSLTVLGPNCAGLANLPENLVVTRLFGKLNPGPTSFVSQSGALMMAIYGLFADRALGLNRLISVGNQVDISLAETLQYLAGDPATRFIAAFLEGLTDGRAFATALREALVAGKPVVLVKSGRTSAGQRAAASHTAAVAGSDRVFAAVCRQFGAILVDDLRPLLDTLQAFACLGRVPDRRVTVLTQSGGMGSLAADWCERERLRLPEPGELLLGRVAAVPHLAALGAHNPLDVRGAALQGSATRQTLEPFLGDPATGISLLLLARTAIQARDIETAGYILEAHRQQPGSLAVVWAGQQVATGPDSAPPATRALVEAGIPVFEQVSDAVKAIARLADYHERRNRWLAHHSELPESEAK